MALRTAQRLVVRGRPPGRAAAEVGSVIAGRYRHKASFSSLHQNQRQTRAGVHKAGFRPALFCVTGHRVTALPVSD
jgi:hypothetical protein